MFAHETTAGTIQVVINGEPRETAIGRTVLGVLNDLEIDPEVVVVERNGRIVDRGRFDEVRLEPGDTLEIVHFVGGG